MEKESSSPPNQAWPGRSRRYRDFHAERVRERARWRAILLVVFLLGGAAAVFAVMALIGH